MHYFTFLHSRELQNHFMLIIYFTFVLGYTKIQFLENKYTFFLGPYGCVDTEHTLSLLRRILEGVEYIHSRGIMHRDLKVSSFNRFYLIRCRSMQFAMTQVLNSSNVK